MVYACILPSAWRRFGMHAWQKSFKINVYTTTTQRRRRRQDVRVIFWFDNHHYSDLPQAASSVPTVLFCFVNTSSLRHLVCFLKSHFTSRYRYTTGGQFAKCCGSKSYNYQTHLCCYNYVVPRHGGPDAKCCGPTSYNHKDSICCSGKVVPRIGGGRTGCCGKQSYSINNEICCESGKVIKLYAPGGTHARCCGQYSYNFLTHICCNGKVLRRQAGCFTKCCGQVRAQLF